MTALLTPDESTLLGLTQTEWEALEGGTRDVIHGVCLRKKPLGQRVAIDIHETSGGPRCYRCPFCAHWHATAHPPEWGTVEAIARAVRDVHGNLPGR